MADITKEIEAYKEMREELEKSHTGKWVVIHDQKLAGVYETFDQAAQEAVSHFGAGPYLIRQVGAPPVVLPASVVYNITYA